MLVDESGRGTEIGTLLNEKFIHDGDALINLHGCHLAGGDENVTRDLSKTVTGVPTKGSPVDTTHPGPGLNSWVNRLLDRLFLPGPKTYVNGGQVK